MTDLIAVDTKNKELIIGEVKRNKNKIRFQEVEQK